MDFHTNTIKQHENMTNEPNYQTRYTTTRNRVLNQSQGIFNLRRPYSKSVAQVTGDVTELDREGHVSGSSKGEEKQQNQ